MKNLSISLILVLTFCVAMSAQTNSTLPCPKIEITGPAGVSISGDTIIFKTNSIENGGNPINYYWTVSDGTIIEGQGAAVIKVATTSNVAGKFLTTTIEVNGLPTNCKNTDSEEVQFPPNCILPIAVDDYAKLSFRDEKLRLDNVALELKNNKDYKDHTAYFLIYLPEEDKIETVKSRISRITNYLTKTHKIPKEKIVIVNGGSGIYRTVIYLYPPGVELPMPDNQTSFNTDNQK